MQFRWNRTDRTQKQRCKHHDDNRAHSFTLKIFFKKSPPCPLKENFQPISLILEKSLRQGHGWWCYGWGMHHVPSYSLSFLLGDSRPGLFLTGVGSKVVCGLWIWYTVMSINTQAFNTYLFWSSRSHRPKKRSICSESICNTQTSTASCRADLREVLSSESSSCGSRSSEEGEILS